MILRRRSFLGGLVTICYPVNRTIGSLMPVHVPIWTPPRNSYTLLTIDMITREAVRLWSTTNAFMQNIDAELSRRVSPSVTSGCR